MENKLSILTKDTGIELEKAKSIWVQFEGFFNSVTEAAAMVDGLEITDVSQRGEMQLAREIRLELKNIRVAAEKTKKQLKDGILKEGRFIDKTYNLIADATKPVEADLLEKENFAKRKEEERLEKLRVEREELIRPYGVEFQLINLANMPNDEFQELLETSRVAHDERIEAERIAEQERLAKEKAEAEERARIEAENARLRREAEERERQIAEERAKAEAERRAAEEVVRKEREERERAERELREEQLKHEREERERLQREIRAKEEAEKAERERIEAEHQAMEEERRRIERAGDREKLSVYVGAVLAIDAPTVKSKSAKEILKSLHDCIQDAVARVETLEKG